MRKIGEKEKILRDTKITIQMKNHNKNGKKANNQKNNLIINGIYRRKKQLEKRVNEEKRGCKVERGVD